MPSPFANLRAAGLAVERTLKQHRWLWRYAHCKRVLDQWTKQDQRRESAGELNSPSANLASARCLLDLRRIANDGEQGRRFHALVTLLSRSGYQLSMVPRLQFLQTGHRAFKATALSTIQPFFEDEISPTFRPFELCLSDRGRPSPFALRTIPVMASTRRPLGAGDLAMPYSFFPAVWDHREDDRFDEYRQRTRLWRLFFGGHCSQASYSRIRKYTRLKPVNRFHVVAETNRFFADSTLMITSDEQLDAAQQGRHESFVMIDNAKYRTVPEAWLGLLAQSDFFLAAPGCDYPLSHNAIEAIAVGTIPVLEYESLFSPALRDGANCITYRGITGLRAALARIESMDQVEIQRIREGAIQYYESHLSPSAFRQQLENAQTERLHLFPYLTPAVKQSA